MLLTLAAMPIGCDDDTSPAGAQPSRTAKSTMNFSVDPALIGQIRRFEDFNVQIAPPAGWEPLPDEQVAAVAAAVATGQQEAATQPTSAPSTAAYPAEPLAVFASREQGVWLIISAVEVADPAAFEAALRGGHNVLNAESFLVSDIEVHQYLVRPPKLVNLKLLLSSPDRKDPRRLQLDYIFPEVEFAKSGHIIESSLGSLRRLGQNGA